MREAPEQTLQGLWFCDLALCRRSGCGKVWATPQACWASGGTKDSHLYRGSAKAPMPWRMCLLVVLKIIQFSSVTQSFPTLPPHGLQHAGLPVHHQLPEFTQTHVHRVGDAIQPSHPLSSPSPPAPNPSQHWGLFQWVNSSHQVPKVLGFQLQHQSFQWIFSTDLLQNGLVGSPCSPRDSQESSPTPQFRSINSSALSFLYSPTLIAVQNDIVQLSHPYKVIHIFQSHHSNYSGRRTDCGQSTRLTLYLFHDPDTGDNTVVQKDHLLMGIMVTWKRPFLNERGSASLAVQWCRILWPTYGTQVQSPGGEDPRCLLARNPEHKTEATL